MASVSKRVRTKADGTNGDRWIVRFKEASGSHRHRTFKKKKDADACQKDIEAQIASGTLARNGSPMTVAILSDDWIETRERLHKEGSLARTSLERDRYEVVNHVVRVLGARRIADLTVNDVEWFVGELRKRKNLLLPGTMSTATVKHITRTLAAMLDYAKRRGFVAQNVAREVLSWPEHRSSKRKVEIRTFKIEEVRRLLIAIEQRAPYQMQRSVDMTRAVIYLGAFCGLRAGEVRGLRIDNIDWDRRLVCVRHNLDRYDNLKEPKTPAGERDVPMPDQVAAALRRWMPYTVASARNLLFTTKKGGRMLVEPYQRDLWRPALQKADLNDIDALGRRFRFHALRHFYASMMVDSRLPDADVARMMGHSSFDLTLRIYTHSTTDAQHRYAAPDQLADRLLPAPSITQELRTDA